MIGSGTVFHVNSPTINWVCLGEGVLINRINQLFFPTGTGGGERRLAFMHLAGTKKPKCMEWLCTGRAKKVKKNG